MPTLDGNLYRCRVRNAFGQVFSNPARLTVVPGYTWTPPNPFIDADSDSYDLALESVGVASYLFPGGTGGVANTTQQTLVGAVFTALGNNSQPVPGGELFPYILFSAYFASAGPINLPFTLTKTSGNYDLTFPTGILVELFDLGFSALDVWEAIPRLPPGDAAGTAILTIPAPGQYVVAYNASTSAEFPAGVLTCTQTISYTLQSGDQIATISP